MLFIVFLSAVLCSITASPRNFEVFRLPPAALLEAQKVAAPCKEETKPDADILKKLLDGVAPNDERNKKFIYCISTRGNYTDENGHFNISKMASLLGDHPFVKPFEEALAECNKITKENPLETTLAMSYCLHNTAPVVFSL